MTKAELFAHEMQAPDAYPASWQFNALLTTGGAVLVRPIQPTDADRLVAFHAKLSPDSVRWRYFGVHPTVSLIEARHVAEVDYATRMSFVAIVGDELVSFASYDRLGPNNPAAEIAFVVADAYQHRGVATLLFECLVSYARSFGIKRFVAEVMMENRDMLDLFASTGLHTVRVAEGGTVRVEIDLHPTREYRAACDAREATAEIASIQAILRPRAIAVVGAGRSPGNVGHEVVRSLLAGDFNGTVHPVNPNARSVCGVAAYATLGEVPERIDLAVIAVPAGTVPKVLDEAAEAGVRAVVIITAGFAETGRSGAGIERDLLTVARRHGIRIVGPNCLGVINTDPEIRMNATFARIEPLAGRLALVSQSGAVGIVLAERARAAGLGLSGFVSIGNKLDVSSNDLLSFFEHDERTSVVALYLESFGNPRKFARIARRIGLKKPIVALKAGRTSAGVRGARSHTAAAATPEVTVSALLQSAGVIKVDRLEDLLDVAAVLLAAPLPTGRRVALVGNSGGPLILAADACEAGGLVVPVLGDRTRQALAEATSSASATANPVDLTADGDAVMLEQALDVVLTDEGTDAIIVVVTELVALSGADARATVARVSARATKPLITCVLDSSANAPASGERIIAEIGSPERAAVALDHVCRYAEWRKALDPESEEPGEIRDEPTVRKIVAQSLDENEEGSWLELELAARLVEAFGIPVLPTLAAHSADEAVAIAEQIGLPVALKVRSGAIVHKSDVGGVALDLTSADEVRAAFDEMSLRIGETMNGVVVQPMAPSGVEAIIGLASDPVFGPVVMVGLGGVLTDLLGDHAFGVPPFDPGTAAGMVGTLRAAQLLEGYRGAPKADRRALVEALETVARVAEEVPELAELDLNPIVVTESGLVVLDCKARIAPRQTGPGPLFRALRSGMTT